MERVLTAARVPAEVIGMVPGIIDTCRECRAWKKPSPDITPALELAVKQNEYVEGDLMFYKRHIILHLIDRADRFHVSREVQSKEAQELCQAIDTMWIAYFGSMQHLIFDGEGSLGSDIAKDYFDHRGIKLRVRAPEQHARLIERRGQILRHSLHCIEDQLERERKSWSALSKCWQRRPLPATP